MRLVSLGNWWDKGMILESFEISRILFQPTASQSVNPAGFCIDSTGMVEQS